MPKVKDLTGRICGKLTVVSRAGSNKHGQALWNCDCSCGNKTVVTGGNLLSGTASCGDCPNRTISFGDSIVILLEHKGYDKACFIDAADYPLVKEHHWCAKEQRKTFYAHSKRGAIYMHALLMGEKNVDHIDGDGLNNRRSNLRIATVSENDSNRGAQINNTTGFKGVTPFHAKFQARITKDGTYYYLGTFNTALEAARAYNEVAKKYHGEFAYLNDVGDHDLVLNIGVQTADEKQSEGEDE
jgi:HNH endonuclease/AP2 domain